MESYAFHLFSAAAQRRFSAGDAVFVWLKSSRSTGRAVVQATPAELAAQPSDGSSRFAGRFLVSFTGSSSTAHVRPERLLPVFPEHERLLLVCYSTDDYRRLCRSQVSERDVVLELGCSYGVATNVLAQHARHVIGVDNSQLVVQEARSRFPHVRFEVADVLQEPAAVLQLIRNNGSSSSRPSDTAQQPCAAGSGPSCTDTDGSSVNVVFVDIGGNRQLQDLVRLLPWVLGQLSPRLVVVKSEELAEAALEQLQQQQQRGQQQQGQEHPGEPTEQQQDQATQQQPAEDQQPQQQHNPCALPAAATAAGRILQPVGWWRRLEAACHLSSSSRAEPWFLAAKAAGFTKHPLRFPLRFTADGTNICRPHNYQRCFKLDSGGCPFDHAHCHHCGVVGHRAVECPCTTPCY